MLLIERNQLMKVCGCGEGTSSAATSAWSFLAVGGLPFTEKAWTLFLTLTHTSSKMDLFCQLILTFLAGVLTFSKQKFRQGE